MKVALAREYSTWILKLLLLVLGYMVSWRYMSIYEADGADVKKRIKKTHTQCLNTLGDARCVTNYIEFSILFFCQTYFQTLARLLRDTSISRISNKNCKAEDYNCRALIKIKVMASVYYLAGD